MQTKLPLPRALPMTIVGLSALLVFKSVALVHAASAELLAATPEKTSVAAPQIPAPPKLDTLLTPSPAAPPAPAAAASAANAPDDLGRQQGELAQDKKDIEARADLLKTANARLAAQLAAIEQQRQAMADAEASRNASDSSAWSDLAKMYEDMAPKNAANIFNVIDVHVLLHILEHMNVRKASGILAAMDPDRAKLATQMLAQQKTNLFPAASTTATSTQISDQVAEPQGK